MIRKICLVSREMEGIAGAGGLKDVVRGIADSLAEGGFDVTVILPGYGFIGKGRHLYDLNLTLFGEELSVTVSAMEIGGVGIRLLGSPYFYSKQDIYTYTDADAPTPMMAGKGHSDVNEMNILLQAAAVLCLMREGSAPDVIHGHDGHTGLLPLFMKKYGGKSGFFDKTGILVTIHNAGAAYQQILGTLEEVIRLTGLGEKELESSILEGKVNPLLAAGIYGHVNTVSPGYARELLTGEDRFSGSLGLSYRDRKIKLKGVYNGIDPQYWIRSIPKLRSGSKSTKAELRKLVIRLLRTGETEGINVVGSIPDPDVPWVLFHGRLAPQKGIDALLKLPEEPAGPGGRFVMIIYGQGDSSIEERLRVKTGSSPDWTFINGYNKTLTGILIASSSFVVVPSEWEPCGQIDMIGQLLGALPVVRDVGGLKKIRNGCDGFKYSTDRNHGLQLCLQTAVDWERKKQRRVSLMRRQAENVIYGRRIWRKVLVRGYLPLYKKARKNIRHRT